MPKEKSVNISIVIPVFNEADNIGRLCEELYSVLEKEPSWEIIFIDDGSSDTSWKVIEGLSREKGGVKGIRLSRNFGHQYALYAGLQNSKGKAVITMDADLQHPPDVIPKLIEEWKKGNKIVHTLRIDHENISQFKKVASYLFYKIFSFLSGVEISAGMADFRLLDRVVVDELLRLNESVIFLRGLVNWIGFPSSRVQFQCRNRFSGDTKYDFLRMVKFAWRGITSFSIIPLRIGILIGILTSIFAFYQLAETIYVKLFTDHAVPGWASTVGVITLLFGVLFILIGLLGEYIGSILIQVRGRPRFVVSEMTTSGPSPGISDYRLQEMDNLSIDISDDHKNGIVTKEKL